MLHSPLTLAMCVLAVAATAVGQNIDMSTLPPRDSVQLTIYNGEDLTLVRESRHVTVKRGVNSLQFSWANTLIDPTSVTLSLGAKETDLELIDTRYPHDRPQVLYWNVESKRDGDAQVEITYFTSGISWAADYVGITDAGDQSMSFDGNVTITNASGEDYEGAQVRMVVGTINLVEKIRDLASRGALPDELVQTLVYGDRLRDMPENARAAGRLMLAEKTKDIGGVEGLGKKQIVKEGLSEYFIFTVPGTETIKNGWSKRMRLFEGTQVPLKTVYRFRPSEYGNQLVRMFLVRNDEKSTLGSTPLPDGWVRLFRKQATGRVRAHEVRSHRTGIRIQPRARSAGDSRASGQAQLARRLLVRAQRSEEAVFTGQGRPRGAHRQGVWLDRSRRSRRAHSELPRRVDRRRVPLRNRRRCELQERARTDALRLSHA